MLYIILNKSVFDIYPYCPNKPLVDAVSNHRALAAWEIANEPEGSIQAGTSDGNPCFDTTNLSGSGVGWTGANIPMYR